MTPGFRGLLVLSLVAVMGSACVSVTANGSMQPASEAPGTATATGAVPTPRSLPTFELPTNPPLPTFELPSIDIPTFPAASAPAPSLPPPGSAQPTAPGEPTVIVTIGSTRYEAFGFPNCNYGLLDEDTWGIEYGNASAGGEDISSARIIDAPDTTAGGERIVSIVIMVGSIFSGGRTFILQGDRFTEPQLEYELNEPGDGTAVAHARGESMQSPLSPGGETVDLTVRCLEVQR